jgi:NAD+ synthetase
LKIGIAQFDPIVGAIDINADLLIQSMAQFEALGVALVVTPEMFLMGYPPMDLVAHPAVQPKVEAALARIMVATESSPLGILVGAPWVAWGGRRRFNSVFLISDGKVQFRWDKQLLPFYDVFYDPRLFVSGEPTHVVEWRGVRLGVLICEDAWADVYSDDYLVNPITQLITQTPDLVLVPTASPFEVNKTQQRTAVLSKVAVRIGKPVVMVNQVGAQDDVVYSGSSLAFNGKGEVVAQIPEFIAGAFVADTECSPIELSVLSDLAQVALAIEMAIRGYVQKSKFSSVVLGVSGGIDSAVVATLAVRALGHENVIGLAMPSIYSSDESSRDARILAQNLGIKLLEIPIQSIYSESLSQLGWEPSPVTLPMENLQSRIRGTMIMAIANQTRSLALSTGNKSELAMGYCTLYGDMNGAIAPLSDLYKTDVIRLAAWLNEDQEVIPEYTIARPPSAELRPDQTDQESLPAYEVLDQILGYIIEEQKSKAEIVALGYAEAMVTDIIRNCHRNEFKRRQAATGVKVSTCAFGPGRRIPILAQWPEE